MEMLPNIKQRINARNKGKNRKYRKKASKIFNISLYHYRGLIEGIFGAEETEHHQLYCRFRLKNNQKRFGLIKALGWNLEVLNRLQCAIKLGISVLQYAIPNYNNPSKSITEAGRQFIVGFFISWPTMYRKLPPEPPCLRHSFDNNSIYPTGGSDVPEVISYM
jgi:hypothetical protein